MTRRGTLAVLAGGFLQGCTPLRAFNALTPRPGGARRIAEGLAYGPLARQTLDIYGPTAATDAPPPILVFFYGGGWEEGSRRDYAFAGRAFAARGFLTAVADYRLTGDAPYPAFLQDCARAVAWMQAHGGDYGGDPARTVLAGHSAGAYNAAMVALDRSWLSAAGAAHPIAGWAGLAGPYDFLPLSPGSALRTFGKVADAATTQPIRFVDASSPPAFLACGDKDIVVKPGNTERLARRLEAAHVPVVERVYPGAGHAELVLALTWPVSARLPVLRDAAGFLHAAAAGTLQPRPR